jgi:hypothetical protein
MAEKVFDEVAGPVENLNDVRVARGEVVEPAPPPPKHPIQQQVSAIPTPAPGQQVVATFKTVYDGNQIALQQQQRPGYRPPYNPNLQNRFAVPQGRDVNASKWLDDNCDNTSYADYYLIVKRKGPAGAAGNILTAEKHIPLMPLRELVQTVQEYAGGGSFRYEICTPDHHVDLTGNFTIPINDFPPKRPEGGEFGEMKPAEAPEIVEKKKEIELLKLDQQKEQITSRAQREDERKRELEMSEAAETRKEMMQLFKESQIEARRMMDESKKESREMMMMFMSSMKEVVGSLKHSDSGSQNVIAEAVKAQGEFLSKSMEMTLATVKSSKDETAAAARATAEQNTKMMELSVNNIKAMAEMNKGSGDKMQELVISLLTKQANHQPMKDVLDLMQKGEDRALEMMEVMNQNRPSPVDPNADPMNNIIAALIDKFSRGGGSPAMAGARPAQSMTPEQINDFARQLAPVVQAHMNAQAHPGGVQALPPPAGTPAANPPAAPVVPHTADLFEGGDMDEEDYPTMATPVVPVQPQVGPSTAPQTVGAQTAPPAPPKSKAEAIQMAGGIDNYDKYVCTQIIQMAIADAGNRANRASWVEQSSIWLSDPLLKAVADAADVPHKALVIQQKCDPAVFEKLKAVTTPESYKVFTEALTALSELIKARQAA